MNGAEKVGSVAQKLGDKILLVIITVTVTAAMTWALASSRDRYPAAQATTDKEAMAEDRKNIETRVNGRLDKHEGLPWHGKVGEKLAVIGERLNSVDRRLSRIEENVVNGVEK